MVYATQRYGICTCLGSVPSFSVPYKRTKSRLAKYQFPASSCCTRNILHNFDLVHEAYSSRPTSYTYVWDPFIALESLILANCSLPIDKTLPPG